MATLITETLSCANSRTNSSKRYVSQ
jgi:hypothetical protein